MDTCICMAESICSPPETITTLLIVYTPIQNKKLKKKNQGYQLFKAPGSLPQGKNPLVSTVLAPGRVCSLHDVM